MYSQDGASTATSQPKMIRTDWKKKKELEEARKAGTAPALQDETGKYVKEFLSVLKQFKVVKLCSSTY